MRWNLSFYLSSCVVFEKLFDVSNSNKVVQIYNYKVKYETKSQIYIAKQEKWDIIKIEWR